jgi:hypothetical protein
MCGSNPTPPATPPAVATDSDGASERRRKKNNAARIMEINAIPPTTPPAMAAAFELCFFAGTGVAVFDVEPATDRVAEAEELEAPAIAPGSTSGVSIK